MVFIRKMINIISPADGKHYDSLAKYEKSLDRKGQFIMSEKAYKQMREKVLDEGRSAKKKIELPNHVHIDFRNDRITTSTRKLDE